MPTTIGSMQITNDDRQYDLFLALIQANLTAAIDNPKTPLFVTDANGLFDLFLGNLPAGEVQLHNCRSCRKFFEKFGVLVTLTDAGKAVPVMWDKVEAPPMYARSVAAIYAAVANANVIGVFYDSARTWGTASNMDDQQKIWRHAAAVPPPSHVWSHRTQSADQAMAERVQDFQTMQRALDEFTRDQLEIAVLITSEDNDLYRAEKVRDRAKWLFDLKVAVSGARIKKVKNHLVWKAVATAPAGWTHPRSSVLGSMLDDIAAGKPYATIKSNFETKLAPQNYQRATVAPSAGTIATAEKLFRELGLERSLLRRYATLGELPAHAFYWTPTSGRTKLGGGPIKQAAPSIFANVQAKNQLPPTVRGPNGSQPMTWKRFESAVLRYASQLELLVPDTANHFMALTTASDMLAPAILQWDQVGNRNPYAWYYTAGADADIRERVKANGGRVEGVDIRGSLAWDNYNDLDLHCLTPAGETIYFGHRDDRTGGNLDVDENAGGPRTNKAVENIRWLKGMPKAGRYMFFVNLYTTHAGGPLNTPFRFELEVAGKVFNTTGVTSRRNPNGPATYMVKVADFWYDPKTGYRTADAKLAMQEAVVAPNVWNMQAGWWVPVTAVVKSPNMWGAHPQPQHGEHAFFTLNGCRDVRQDTAVGLLPEWLQGDLRPVRSVIEAYMIQARLGQAYTPDACGYGISTGSTGDVTVRVNGSTLYTITAWE